MRGFCDRQRSSRGVERSPCGEGRLPDSFFMGFGRLRTESSCTESSLRGFCEVFVIAGGVLAESSGLGRSPCGDGTSSSTQLLQVPEDSAWSRRVRSRRGVDDVVAAKTGTATVSSCRGVHLVVAMAGTTEHSFGAWLHPGSKLFALVLCVHSYSQDRCDKTFVLLMRAPRCNNSRHY